MKPTILLACACVALAQTGPRFEVASIKPSGEPRTYFVDNTTPRAFMTGARFDIQLASLMALVTTAYRVEAFQVSGPSWMAETRFDIVAKPPAGATNEQIPEMLRALLIERFHLAVRTESKEETVYVLSVGKDGSKLKEAPEKPTEHPPSKDPNGRHVLTVMRTDNGVQTISERNGRLLFEADRATMLDIARALRGYVDAPVVDETGLKGIYEVSLELPSAPLRGGRGRAASADVSPADAASEPAGISVFASVQKLGLKLEKRKAPMDHIVIERIDKTPSEN
jgi:uncharacterized protein (TIGR03435 family)